MKKTIEVEIDIIEILEQIDDRHRAECVTAIIKNISNEGIIDEIRAIVNDKSYDD